MIAAILLFSTWVILGIPVAIVTLPWAILSRNVLPLYRGAIGVVRCGLRLAGIRVEVSGRDSLDPSQHYLFFSNHVSNLDPPVLIPLLPVRTSAFLKRSLMKIPILGVGMRLANFIPVDRDGRVESAIQSTEDATRVLAAGVNVLSFVEGTRSRDGRLQPFKKGSFYLAMRSGAPVVPVSIYGTESMMKRGSIKIHPGTAHVVFHRALRPQDYASREDLMEAVRTAIASGLPEWMRA
ncbi:MAG TPA: lysophospholipid acyltransferase family protein [Acidobacteriaceae bacterium]|jgi:1-acyl-sn-glycerol-3-phosphate acyltransferase|nr:lysophospholipid acyltransferase family protein [Acidobacteriaceae bacterium]